MKINISYRDIWIANPILFWIINRIKFNRSGFFLFFLIVVFPFIFSSVAAFYEDRLFLGSLSEKISVATLSKDDYVLFSKEFDFKGNLKSTDVGGKEIFYINIVNNDFQSGIVKVSDEDKLIARLRNENKIEEVTIKGMSYVGDTMVWPFYILIFSALVFLKWATKKLEEFFKNSHKFIKIDTDVSQEIFQKTLAEVKACLKHEGGWKILKYTGILLGAVFVIWNALSCTLPEWYPQWYPYKSDKVLLFYENNIINLQDKIDIEKWDVNMSTAFYSWLSARTWVVFGYFLIPIILVKLVNLVCAVFVFCLRIGENNLLVIRPISEDDAGGFSSLSDVALAFVRVIVPFSIMTLAAFMKEATPPSIHNYLLTIGFVPIFFMVFFTPIYSFHVAMKNGKKQYLFFISQEYNKINKGLFFQIKDEQVSVAEIDSMDKKMIALKKMYDQVNVAPEWPVEIKTVYRFIAGFSIPPALTAFISYFAAKLNY